MQRREPTVVIRPTDVDAVIFDMDGVVTDTARTHALAWKRLFDEYLQERASRTGEPFAPFDAGEDYLLYVDGKPRFDGVRDFLASRHITLPEDTPGEPDAESVRGLGDRKNQYFLDTLESEGAEPYDSTLALIDELRQRGVKTAVISASQNAAHVLQTANADGVFDARVDGTVAGELGLPGKPDPAVFLEAARRVGVSPDRAIVVEDAVAGVTAGKKGGFGLVIGVDRGGNAQSLTEAGADVVVTDLSEVGIEDVADAASPSASGRPIDTLPSAIDTWPSIASLFNRAAPAVFLDYDGTLTPIVERPEDAKLEDGMRDVVRRLAALVPVVVVSGRDVAFVVEQVAVDDVVYLGSHGFDIVAPGHSGLSTGREGEFERFIPALDAAEAALAASTSGIEGARIERKRYAIAVHYRQVADESVPDLEAAVDAELTHRPTLRKSGGKKVFELRPDIDWDKGHAVLWALRALGLGDRDAAVPIYVGDDLTDEDAFAALKRDGGLGVVVGSGDRLSHATARVPDVDGVRELLDRMTALVEGADA
jgi:trehalose 6-phosphate phosphatase